MIGDYCDCDCVTVSCVL